MVIVSNNAAEAIDRSLRMHDWRALCGRSLDVHTPNRKRRPEPMCAATDGTTMGSSPSFAVFVRLILFFRFLHRPLHFIADWCAWAATSPRPRDELLTCSEVALLFHVSSKTVTRWAGDGALPALRTKGGHRRSRRSDVLRSLIRMYSGQEMQPPR